LTTLQLAARASGNAWSSATDLGARSAKRLVPPEPAYTMYRGLGSWVDIYDDAAWSDPAATVRDMAGHGVRTIYIETANSSSSSAFVYPGQLATFVREAHARKIKVVAWYLADMLDVESDWGRIKQAIEFTTSDGQKFDSFALDIESEKVADVGTRNSRLLDLSGRTRGLVGPEYPLGAIIPSPWAISTKSGYWPGFPYESLAKTYDVFVPMSYYTYHGSGGPAAYADTMANVRILREQPGCAKTPIHLIGGVAENSSDTEVREFVRAARETQVYGASLYSWPATTDAHWTQLAAVK
jgi:hypothetical protein